MTLGVSLSPYTDAASLKTSAVSVGEQQVSGLPGPKTDTPNKLVPSVTVSLSEASQSNDSINASDQIPTVYTRPTSAITSRASGLSESPKALSDDSFPSGEGSDKSEQSSREAKTEGVSISNLSDQELQIVEKLQARDREVRTHEQAHKTVGGQYAGAISFSYQSGPDGRRYAVGGEVPIDVSPIPGDPQATISKMTIVKAAATAPAQPSAQDIMVAAEASRILMEAQNDLSLENNDTAPGQLNKNDSNVSGNQINSTASVQNTVGSTTNNAAQADVFQQVSGLGSEIESQVDILI